MHTRNWCLIKFTAFVNMLWRRWSITISCFICTGVKSHPTRNTISHVRTIHTSYSYNTYHILIFIIVKILLYCVNDDIWLLLSCNTILWDSHTYRKRTLILSLSGHFFGLCNAITLSTNNPKSSELIFSENCLSAKSALSVNHEI